MHFLRTGAGVATVSAMVLLGAGPAMAEQVSLTGSGSGADEAPGPGEEGATIEGDLTVDTDTGTITYTVSVAGNAEDVAAAHIHEAPVGTAGEVVVPLDEAAVGAGAQATATVEPELAQEIADDPENYYLNAHSESFPDGFARGQLTDAAPSSVPAGDGSSASGPAPLVGVTLLAVGAAALVLGAVRRRRGGVA
jgi:hypothetical protein